MLLAAAEKDWKEVEPAIFGTLVERALEKKERSRLGAHYTPRSYVERLVRPVVMEPCARSGMTLSWSVYQNRSVSEANRHRGTTLTVPKVLFYVILRSFLRR